MGWRDGEFEWITDELIRESRHVVRDADVCEDEVYDIVNILVNNVRHLASFTLIRLDNLDKGIVIFEDNRKVLSLFDVLESVNFILDTRVDNGEIDFSTFSNYKELRNLAVRQWNRLNKFENVVIGTYKGHEMTFREYVEYTFRNW